MNMQNSLVKNQDESFYDYFKRIVYGKLVDKTIDFDYEELSEYIFGEGNCYNSSEVRKRMYGMKRLLDVLELEGFENLSEDEVFAKLEKKKLEIQKERIKLSTLRNDLSKEVRSNSIKELLWEEVLKAIPTAKEVEFHLLKPNTGDKSYLLNFSDIHYSSFFASKNNEYSIDIVKERFDKLLGELIELIKKENISKLYILNNSDSIQGLIRISDLKKNQIGLLQSVVDFSRFMGDWLNTLSQYVEIVYYHVATANHSELRIFDKDRGQTDENLEYLIVNYIHDYLKNNKRVYVPIVEDESIEFQLQGYNFIAMHGDQIKNVKTAIEKLSMRNRKFYDYCILGHFHSSFEQTLYEGVDNNVEILIAPSIVGSDPYSDSLLVGGKSSAKLHIFMQGKGRIQTNNIILN